MTITQGWEYDLNSADYIVDVSDLATINVPLFSLKKVVFSYPYNLIQRENGKKVSN